MPRKILGLDIGTSSVAYSIIETSEEKKINTFSDSYVASNINNDRLGFSKDENGNPILGVRIISQDTDRFDRGLKLNDPKGSALTPTANRRKFRGVRRLKNRYKLRRNKLFRLFSILNIKPDDNYYTNIKRKRGSGNDIGKALYELRSRAAKNTVSLEELCRVILHLNQLRGYSSDRFTKDEDTKFDYFLTEILELDWDAKVPIYEKNSTTEIKYYQVKIKLRFVEPYEEFQGEQKVIFETIEGYIFKKEFKFRIGDFITVKNPEIKEIKKGKITTETYYKITPTTPDPNDWKYKYQTLHKELAEWCKSGGTVGSYFYENFYTTQILNRIRNNVVNRDWYEREFDTIWNIQYEAHKDFFNSIDVEQLTKDIFKDYSQVINDVVNKEDNREKLRTLIKDKIIFYQRPWQQAKNKGRCEFEKIKVKREYAVRGTGIKEFKEEYIGRHVIPRSHPLFQKFKIWQQINNLKLFYNTSNEKNDLFQNEELFKKHTNKTVKDVKLLLFNRLNQSKTLNWRVFVKEELELEIFDEIEEKRKAQNFTKQGFNIETGEVTDNFYSINFRKRKKDGTYEDLKIKGNTTKAELKSILNSRSEEWFEETHHQTKDGIVSNLQLLWEIIYDITITDINKVAEILKRQFNFDDTICKALAKIKFDDSGMANLSAKAIRNILPLMSDGKNILPKTAIKISELIKLNKEEAVKDDKLESIKNFVTDKKARLRLSKFNKEADFTYLNYWEAVAIVYGSHSSRNIKARNNIEKIKPHSMNNPVVEKIVNETISIVNEVYKKYPFDEVRIELSRELKASAEERQQMWESMNKNTTKNEWAKKMLREIKQALIEDNRDASRIDDALSGSNIDKIKIIEDVVKYKNATEFKAKEKEYKLSEPSNAEITKYLLWLEQNFKCPYTNQPIPLTDVFARGNVVEIEHIIPRERYYSNAYANKVITWREVNQLKESNGNRTAYEFIVSKRLNNTVRVGGKTFDIIPATQWEEHVKAMFPKGRKRNNLLRKEIPEDPIERTLKETQYVNKKLKEKLSELVGSDRVWVTSGAITDILREKWNLNNVWKELLEYRFTKFNIGENKGRLNLKYTTKHFNTKTGQEEDVEKIAGMSKRIDHRHHALDAIIIACTKQSHIQYINNLNTINNSDIEEDDSRKRKYKGLKDEICISTSKTKFKFPWDENRFLPEVKKAMHNVLVSHKNNNVLISPSKHRNGKDIKSGKVASIRGELHLQTNYAKKKYFENEKLEIVKLITLLFKKKFENQNQTMVHSKKFEQIIKETVLKSKYQELLIPLFSCYENELFTATSTKEYIKKVLTRIQTEKILVHSKTGKPITWLSVYTEKNASVRPMGLLMDINNEKEIKDIANPRLRRIATYRLNYVNEKITAIKKQKLFKDEENALIREIKEIPLYSNAIYEVRIKAENSQYKWIEIKDLKQSDCSNIEYPSMETTKVIKKKISEQPIESLKKTYISRPISISNKLIPVKKARQKSFFQDLYQLNDGRYVYSRDIFMTYIFVSKGSNRKDGEREIHFLKFFDAVKVITLEKPNKIDYSTLLVKPEHNLLFTLSKNDIVYMPEEKLTDEQMSEINWAKRESIIPKLFVVKDMNPSRNEIIFQHINKSDSITISEDDVKELFKKSEGKSLKEEIKYGDTKMWKRCIKVSIDKLSQEIKPYWIK